MNKVKPTRRGYGVRVSDAEMIASAIAMLRGAPAGTDVLLKTLAGGHAARALRLRELWRANPPKGVRVRCLGVEGKKGACNAWVAAWKGVAA